MKKMKAVGEGGQGNVLISTAPQHITTISDKLHTSLPAHHQDHTQLLSGRHGWVRNDGQRWRRCGGLC